MRRPRPAVTLSASLLAAAVVSLPALATTSSPAARFAAPVLLTNVPGFGGFEPSAVVDRSGRVWVTAHKTYYGNALSPDLGAPTAARAASWLWTSTDGVHFTNPPGATAGQEQNGFFGDEADLAVDAKNNVYFTDLNLASNSFVSWSSDPRTGALRQTYATPTMPFAQAGTDRPFLAAGGAGTVLFTENQVVQSGYGSGSQDPTEPANGQQAVYVSHDGGRTLTSSVPYLVRGSSWCRPSISRTDARRFTLVCTDGKKGLFAEVSADAGKTWIRHSISTTDGAGFSSHSVADFPSVAQAPDGTLYVLYDRLAFGDVPVVFTLDSAPSATLLLFSSKDGGRTWSRRDVTPQPGIWAQASLAAAPDGRLGLQAYYRPNQEADWTIRAGVFSPRAGGERVGTTDVSPGTSVAPSDHVTPPGDFTQCTFGPDGKLRVVWNALVETPAEPAVNASGDKLASANIFYAQQR